MQAQLAAVTGPVRFGFIFEPYFTTKAAGLGMGLMICRTIVESHGGALRLTAGRVQGASFRFTLPIVREPTAKGAV